MKIITKRLCFDAIFANLHSMRVLVGWFCLILMTTSPVAAIEAANAKPNISIWVDDSILVPMARIARIYTAKTDTPLTVVAIRGDDTRYQIEQGLEVHVMLTANRALINELSAQGLTDVSSRAPVAATQLALVSASNLDQQANIAKRISFATMLYATPSLPIYINAPDTMEGQYALKVREREDFSPKLRARFVTKSNQEELVAALRDTPSLALMLAADALAVPDIRILSLLPEEVSAPVTFDAVVLASESMREASDVARFLLSPPAQEIFARQGFQPANP